MVLVARGPQPSSSVVQTTKTIKQVEVERNVPDPKPTLQDVDIDKALGSRVLEDTVAAAALFCAATDAAESRPSSSKATVSSRSQTDAGTPNNAESIRTSSSHSSRSTAMVGQKCPSPTPKPTSSDPLRSATDSCSADGFRLAIDHIRIPPSNQTSEHDDVYTSSDKRSTSASHQHEYVYMDCRGGCRADSDCLCLAHA